MPETNESNNNTGNELVVVHFKNHVIMKGVLVSFDKDYSFLKLQLADAANELDHEVIKFEELKAVYFVQSLIGDSAYNEQKGFRQPNVEGRRVLIKFVDGEIICGHIRDDDLEVLSESPVTVGNSSLCRGFFLYPADVNTNNIKIFIINSSITETREI